MIAALLLALLPHVPSLFEVPQQWYYTDYESVDWIGWTPEYGAWCTYYDSENLIYTCGLGHGSVCSFSVKYRLNNQWRRRTYSIYDCDPSKAIAWYEMDSVYGLVLVINSDAVVESDVILYIPDSAPPGVGDSYMDQSWAPWTTVK